MSATRDALLLVGHGSARHADATEAMRRHAETLHGMQRFAQVEVALLHGAPSIEDALARLGPGAVRVVPFFMEDGYLSRLAVGQALQRRPVLVCLPVGVHDGVAGIIERQAMAACDQLGVPSRSAAIVIIGHGSASAPGRTLALHRHAARVAATELFGRVEPACLEEAPLVADTLTMLRGHPVVAIGFFANHGSHVEDDVPALLAAERAARGDAGPAVVFHGCVADDPAMTTIILDQAESTSPGA